MTHPPVDFSPLLRHLPGKVGLLFSGGKDSLVLLDLFRPYLEGITVYHGDTGDLMPSSRRIVVQVAPTVPHFVRMQGDVLSYIDRVALPTDLLPSKNTPLGLAHRTDGKRRLILMEECCSANRWQPWTQRLAADGITLVIHGQRKSDVRSFEARWGDKHFGLQERWGPIQDWSDRDVFRYLEAAGIEPPEHSRSGMKSPECATCSAWDPGRAAYLRQHHPELAARYRRRLEAIAGEVEGEYATLQSELRALR